MHLRRRTREIFLARDRDESLQGVQRWSVHRDAPCFPSPAGRRWCEAPDEGKALQQFTAARYCDALASSAFGTFSRWEKGSQHLNFAQVWLAKVSLFKGTYKVYLASPSRHSMENVMSNWLKKFEETAFGMLFQDQYLSPSEVVRIAEETQASDKTRRCGTSADTADVTPEQTDTGIAPAPSASARDTRLSAPR
jgi:hypothetical protein